MGKVQSHGHTLYFDPSSGPPENTTSLGQGPLENHVFGDLWQAPLAPIQNRPGSGPVQSRVVLSVRLTDSTPTAFTWLNPMAWQRETSN